MFMLNAGECLTVLVWSTYYLVGTTLITLLRTCTTTTTTVRVPGTVMMKIEKIRSFLAMNEPKIFSKFESMNILVGLLTNFQTYWIGMIVL